MEPRRWRWEQLANMSNDIGTAPNFALDFAKTRFCPFCKVALVCDDNFSQIGNTYECGMACGKDPFHYYECMGWKKDCGVYLEVIDVSFDYNDVMYRITFNLENAYFSPGPGKVRIK